MLDLEKLYEEAAESIIDADETRANEILKKAKDEGVDLLDLLMKGYSPGNEQLGDYFDRGLISLPELIYATDVMKNITRDILFMLNEDGSADAPEFSRGTVVVATVEGDIHDIGKGIVASTLRTAGFKVYDLGCEVPVEKILEKAREYDADIIGTSALLTSTLGEQKKLEKLLSETSEKGRFITMVGGAPCTSRWARKIGADGYSENAMDAVRVALALIKKKKGGE